MHIAHGKDSFKRVQGAKGLTWQPKYLYDAVEVNYPLCERAKYAQNPHQ
jgi:hypothetical protein